MRHLVGIIPAILPNLCQRKSERWPQPDRGFPGLRMSRETLAISGFAAMHGVPSGVLIRLAQLCQSKARCARSTEGSLYATLALHVLLPGQPVPRYGCGMAMRSA